MAVMDEFRDERNKVKDASFKVRAAYFWDYHKWYIIGGLVVLIILGAFIHDMVTQKEILLEAALPNVSVHLEDTEDYNDKLLKDIGMDTDKYALSMDTSLKISFGIMDETAINSSEKLSAYVAASMLDIMIAGDDIFSNYANAGIFNDIRASLSDEEIEKYSPYFYYVDTNVVKQVQIAETQMDSSLRPEIPDPVKPELMESPVPVGIYIDSCEDFLNVYTFPDSDHVVVGILDKAPDEEMAVTFINYIFNN